VWKRWQTIYALRKLKQEYNAESRVTDWKNKKKCEEIAVNKEQ
jgi:hypothetical protein